MPVVVRFGFKTLAMAALLVVASASHAAADVCYLTTGGSSCGPASGGNTAFNAMNAIFRQVAPQTAGNVFLAMQGSPTEQGYNTDLSPFQSGFNMVDTNNATHSIRLNDVPVTDKNGQVPAISATTYRQFFLDIQEPSALPNLTLDKLQIFLGPNGLFNNYASGTLNGNSPIYDLDSGMDRWIRLDYSLNSTGTGDMVAYLPNSLFTTTDTNPNPYVYLYAQFGTHRTSDGSFEEWWVNSPLAPQGGGGPATPEPAGLVLLGSGLVLAVLRLRRKSPGDSRKVPSEQTKVTVGHDFSPHVL